MSDDCFRYESDALADAIKEHFASALELALKATRVAASAQEFKGILRTLERGNRADLYAIADEMPYTHARGVVRCVARAGAFCEIKRVTESAETAMQCRDIVSRLIQERK